VDFSQIPGQAQGMKNSKDIDPSDQNVFILDSDDFKKFEKALAAAPNLNDLIDALKKRPSPWRRE
jgi:hypothetical protein